MKNGGLIERYGDSINTSIELKQILAYAKEKGFFLKGEYISAEDVVFEERVKLNCFYCGKYNTNWKCPPRIPDVDYRRLLAEFERHAFVYVEEEINAQTYQLVRNESALHLHRGLLACERYLYEHNKPVTLSFIGGSCRLCKNGCGKEGCANPYKARSSVEAIGINVIKSAKKCGIDIVYPPEGTMKRVGLLLW